MTAALILPPALEPVTLTEAKAHLRLDTGDDDSHVSTLITAARAHVEMTTGRVLIEQGWRVYHDDFPAGGCLDIPVAPVLSVDELYVYDGNGTPNTVDASNYQVDLVSVPARLALLSNSLAVLPGRPLNGIEIDITAGYGPSPSDVPCELRHAILMLVAHWYEHREAAFAGVRDTVPLAFATLIAPFRRLSL